MCEDHYLGWTRLASDGQKQGGPTEHAEEHRHDKEDRWATPPGHPIGQILGRQNKRGTRESKKEGKTGTLAKDCT